MGRGPADKGEPLNPSDTRTDYQTRRLRTDMTERSEASELPVAKEAVAVSEEETEAVVEPVGSEGGVLSAEDLFADDDWDGRIERLRRYLTDRNFRIGPDMTDEDVMSAAEMLALSEAHIVSDLDVLRGLTTETQAEFDNLPGVEKLKRLIKHTGGSVYYGDEWKRELEKRPPPSRTRTVTARCLSARPRASSGSPISFRWPSPSRPPDRCSSSFHLCGRATHTACSVRRRRQGRPGPTWTSPCRSREAEVVRTIRS